MLEALIKITSTEPYSSRGGMRIKEISIRPWETPDAKMLLEIWTNDLGDDPHEFWEVTCSRLGKTDGIPLAVFGGAAIRLYEDHPLLWEAEDEIYFSITGGTGNVPDVMGELFIEHCKACGGWVDFHWLYSGLAETIQTLRENQLAIPARLKEACFGVLDRHGVSYQINSVTSSEDKYRLLLFSCEANWPDGENFRQPYIMAKDFSARQISS